ncbi:MULTISPECIES: hypothetical protein [unclassified Acinetobacter]|uniref:hypothetical protein n=1 Tax=unclassified Acinetobacter TaxID=196816 RepID=UPI002934959C|nr:MULTISPECIES: hypothetical protein [unclassified Acinetobacter]WOE32192.1 hypothetical protein QSG84_02965 [Acinetobacter sp. SAAs470]WOE37662.1 hypothetical protein QSG86_12010 [Acinetobacter sp. SAAs474]
MNIEKLTEFAKTGDKNTDELDLERGFPSRIYPARQWFNWLFNELTKKINELIDNKVDKSAISELSEIEAGEGIKTDSKLISASVLKDAITTHAPKPANASTEIKGIVQLNNTLTSNATDQALTAAQGKFIYDRMFGVGQDYQDVKLSRILGTTYTNPTLKPRMINVSIRNTTTGISAETIKVTLNEKPHLFSSGGLDNGGAYKEVNLSLLIPPMGTYKIESTSGGIIVNWLEF